MPYDFYDNVQMAVTFEFDLTFYEISWIIFGEIYFFSVYLVEWKTAIVVGPETEATEQPAHFL